MLFKREVAVGKGTLTIYRTDEVLHLNGKITLFAMGNLRGSVSDVTVDQIEQLETACRELRESIQQEGVAKNESKSD